MSRLAPLRAPVELRQGEQRWFRSAHGVSELGLLFPTELTPELDGPIDVRFHLPEDDQPIRSRARVITVDADERGGPPERRAVRFIALDEETRARIARYVEERVNEERPSA